MIALVIVIFLSIDIGILFDKPYQANDGFSRSFQKCIIDAINISGFIYFKIKIGRVFMPGFSITLSKAIKSPDELLRMHFFLI